MFPNPDRQAAIAQLAEKIKGIRMAMLTTVDMDGSLHSRPMAMVDQPFDGTLWFFTDADAPKVDNVERDAQVNVSFAKPDDHRFVSMSGTATLVRDQQKIDALWQPMYQAWFPQGKDGGNLALLRIEVASAEYWDAPSNPVVRVTGLAKALFTGQQADQGENAKLDVQP